jgi:hypothetical protein
MERAEQARLVVGGVVRSGSNTDSWLPRARRRPKKTVKTVITKNYLLMSRTIDGAKIRLDSRGTKTKAAGGAFDEFVSTELTYDGALIWKRESHQHTGPKGSSGGKHTARLSKDKQTLTVFEEPADGSAPPKLTIDVNDLVFSHKPSDGLHAALLRGSGVSPSAIAALSGADAAPQCAARRSPAGLSLRVLNWNLLADGLSDDGFLVRDVLDGESGVDEKSMITELMAAKRAGKDMSPFQEKYATARARENTKAVMRWTTRWARMLDVIESLDPDVITVQELDHMQSVELQLRARGYDCRIGGEETASYVPAHVVLGGKADVSVGEYADYLTKSGAQPHPHPGSPSRIPLPDLRPSRLLVLCFLLSSPRPLLSPLVSSSVPCLFPSA